MGILCWDHGDTITSHSEGFEREVGVFGEVQRQNSSKKEPRWNFWKYLISPEGKVVKFWRPEEPIENIKPEIAALVREIIVKRREDL
ncbi:hypothetical protein JRQ81_012922 [Phrynocephalus forsythii]|uniref:Glutathione peroxidase n=1 Tax=Phrynocephalus forsythii TaxID=171643 RepID=A0A9Q1B494_9SAUR|nr:hypothetical protein JRQ81_012922 [Phrynocephalus forsythii]